jgi:uncharacterized protein DUF4232
VALAQGRLTRVGALSVLAALALAGCGATKTVTVIQTTTRTVTTTKTVTAAGPAASSPCAATDLAGSFRGVPGSAGAGQISYALVVKNTSGSSCFVTGLPVVQLLGADGTALPTKVSPAQPGATTAVKVSLAPGDSAKAEARFSPDVPGVGESQTGACEPKAVQMRVTAPGGGTFDVPVIPATSVCEHGSLRFDVYSSA